MVLGIKVGFIECATVCVKSVVILSSLVTVVVVLHYQGRRKL